MDSPNRPYRGRPRNEERRDHIVHAAVELFSQHGYDGTTLNQIAKRAGIAPSLLRHYFTRKSDIAQEIISMDSRLFEKAIDTFGSIGRIARSCEEFLHHIGLRYREWVISHEWHYALWIQDLERFQSEERPVSEQMNRVHRAIARALQRLPDFKGEEADALFAVRTLFGAIFYCTLLKLRMGLESLPGTREENVKRVASMIAREISG